MGDFNAKVGRKEEGNDTCLGDYGFGSKNHRGEMLRKFAEANNMKIINSFYKKHLSRRWTWRHPNGVNKNEIDCIMTDKLHYISDISVINQIRTSKDHRFLRCKMKFDVKMERSRLIGKHKTIPDVQTLK